VNLVLLLAGAGVTFVLDRFTKTLIARRPRPGPGPRYAGLNIRLVEHRYGHATAGLALVLLSIMVAVVCAARAGLLFHTPAARVAIGAALGGAASNLYDRLTRGAVLDFIDLGWWPVFNLADVAITCGVITALLV